MTSYTTGTRVCYRTGARREGVIFAIVIPLDGRPDRVWVKQDDGTEYHERADKLVRAAQRKEDSK
jgi:hypothetical protein